MAKRRRKKRKYKFKNIFFLLMLIIIGIYFINNIPRKNENLKKDSKEETTNITYLNNISKDDNFNDEIDKELENKIIKYMDTYFKVMTTLKEIDMTTLFNKNAYEEAYIHQTAISTLINIRKLELNDMKIDKAKYDIIFTDISKSDSEITVTFLENDYLNFNFMKDTKSKVIGIENTIIFNNDYEILSVRKVQDFYVMVTNKYNTGKNNKQAKKELDKIKEDHISDYKKEIEILKVYKEEFESNKNKPSKTCDNKYDRKDALTYAKKYVLNKNDKWMDYASIGGNCQNYASQVLHAGGIPMDTYGNSSLQWKHYDSKIDESNNKSGRSSSWTTVPAFYDYAKDNEGFGLCAKVDINPYYAEAGDIGQVGYDENYRHTVVITGKIKDENKKVVDLLINSNSVNLENYPLSGYVYPYKRIIKIFGYND